MNTSVCITVLNEESSIGPLLDSLFVGSKKPDEVIVVDGGSEDGTLEVIKHYSKHYGKIKFLKENCSRSEGRNIGVEVARNKIIVMTDAGCRVKKNWLKNITAPFENEIDVCAGFYSMTGKTRLQKAASVFLGVQPGDFDAEFLPSTRSIAFTKDIWEKAGGFPEKLNGAAEDTIFNLRLVKIGAKIARVKNALVEWGMPGELGEFFWKIYGYAKGDAKSKVWLFPGKGLMSHNIKAVSVLLRYVFALLILILAIKYSLLPFFLIFFLGYVFWSFRKVFIIFREIGIALYGPILQIVSDLGVITGFLSGIVR